MLCINLPGATERWHHVKRVLSPLLPPALTPVHRVDGVNGATLSLDDSLHMTLHCRLLLEQPWRVCNGMQIESRGALGCLLSHIRCWEWLKNHPTCPFALILEDDCCLVPTFAEIWEQEVIHCLKPPSDIVVLGYERGRLPLPIRRRRMPNGRDGFSAYPFVGTHCYVVTQRGCQQLLAHAYPLHLPVDVFLVACMYLGTVCGLVWPRSLA